MKPQPLHERHHAEDEAPPESLIHHDEPTLLEQWFRRGMERGAAFWATVGLILAAVVATLLLVSWWAAPDAEARRAWSELAVTGTDPAAANFGADPLGELPDLERLYSVPRYEGTAAARWAKLRAATLLLNEGSAQLATSRRETGAERVLEAAVLFDEIKSEAKEDELKQLAALGLARAAEARLGLNADELTDAADALADSGIDAEPPGRVTVDEVVALYEQVAEDYPDSFEGEQATELARRLRRPDSVAFYESLASYDPDLAVPGGPSPLDLGPGSSSPLSGPAASGALDNLFGSGPSGLPLPGSTGTGMPAGGAGSGSDLFNTPVPGLDDLPPPSGVAPGDVGAPEVAPPAGSAEVPMPTVPIVEAPATPTGENEGEGQAEGEGEAMPAPSDAAAEPTPTEPADDSAGLPTDPFAPAPKPAAEPSPAEEPAPAPPSDEPAPAVEEPSPSGELPGSVFSGDEPDA